MNNTIKLLFDRKSVRSYEDKPVSPENVDLILESALQAPTAGNQILYTILHIENQSLKDSLAVTCDNQPFIAKAPLVLVFLADCRRWLDLYGLAGAPHRLPGGGDLLLACSDALIAAQNTVVAAGSLGIGSCYIGDILENGEQVAELLNLDEYTVPVCMLVYGYPSEQQKSRPKPVRFGKEYIVQKDTYSRLSDEDLQKMLQQIHPEKDFCFESYMKAFCERKYMSDFACEMNRSSEQYIRKFLEHNTGEKGS